MPRDIDYYLLQMAWGVHSDFKECPYLAACLKLKEEDGYIASRISSKRHRRSAEDCPLVRLLSEKDQVMA